MKTRLVHLGIISFWLASFFASISPAFAQNWRPLSPDIDGDGLPNGLEEAGWYNAVGGPFFTDPLDADTDDDGLTDGEEKLFDANPLDSHSPGIYVEYTPGLQTKRFYPWQRFGNKYLALPTPGQDAIIVRRGSTFSVGGPVSATLTINKSLQSLTTLTPARDNCAGRWTVAVPSGGTVGIYGLTMREGSWSKSLNLYVIFQLPTNKNDAFIDAFVYDDNTDSARDTSSLGYYEYEGSEYNKYEYTHQDYAWIPEGEWVNHGYIWSFNTQHYRDFLFRDHVMPTINGQTTSWNAINALVQHTDDVTCFGNPRYLSSSYCVLNPSLCGPDYDNRNQCTNIANLLAAFSRAAGIPARPVFTDWMHSTFDHSTEVWTKPSSGSTGWYVARGYNVNEYSLSHGCPSPHYTGGNTKLRSTSGWYSGSNSQGVYAANENWLASDLTGGWPGGDDFRQGSWDNRRIVKKSWWETRFRAYWGWPAEPQVTGTPPEDWPDYTYADSQSILTSTTSSADSVIQFGQVVADYGVDLDGDSRYDQLVFKIQVEAMQAGHYWIRGRLTGAGTEAIGDVYLEKGRYTIELPFEGQDIYMNKVDGPYTLQALWITDVENPTLTDWAEKTLAYLSPAYQTHAFRFSEFGVAGATLSDPIGHAVDTDGDGYADALLVETDLDIAKPGTYTVQGALSAGQDKTPIVASWTGPDSHVTLQFDGLRDTVGPYTLLGLHVRNAAGQVTDGLQEPFALGQVPELSAKPILMGDQAAMPSNPSLFAPTFIITNTGYSDRGVDTDGDGRFDQLVITVAVQVAPGEGGQAYRIEGWLVDSNDSLVSYAIGAPTVLTDGIQSLALAFDGRILNEHGVDGPYTLVALQALPGSSYTVLNKVDVAYTTPTYNHDQFETAAIPPATNAFADNMEDGTGQWTATNPPWGLDTSVWNSYSHAWKASASGSRVGSLTTLPLDLSSYVQPTLRYKTCYTMQTASDAGYLETSTDGVNWTRVATYTNSTPHWSTKLVDLSSFSETPNVQIRFKANSKNRLRWYVDDVYIDAWWHPTYLPVVMRQGR